MSSTVLASMFGFKSWANRELFALLAGLEPPHAEPLRTCVRTLNHIDMVDRIFRAHLSGEPRPFDATQTDATPALELLRSRVAETDAWYEGYVGSIGPADLASVIDFEFTDGERGRMSREEILLHVITHGGYHRGNVGQVLRSIAVAPPRDLYTTFLHRSQPERRAN